MWWLIIVLRCDLCAACFVVRYALTAVRCMLFVKNCVLVIIAWWLLCAGGCCVLVTVCCMVCAGCGSLCLV